MRTIYLDNNATTAVLPDVFEAMRPYFVDHYGNASSVHHVSTKAAVGLRRARQIMSRLLGCEEGELIFTSCGTESDNAAIRGVLEATPGRRHIVTTAVEHPAVLNVIDQARPFGYDVTVLGVDADGQIDLGELEASLTDGTALVSIMFANNETGVLFPMEEIVRIVKERGIPLHTDAVQAIGKVPIDVSELPVDMLALSAHKFHGPKGVGALFLRKGLTCNSYLVGGGQERGRRAGTENVGGLVAMAMALEHAVGHLDHYQTETRRLRDKLESGLVDEVPDAFVNGARSPRLPNTSNICFRGVDAHAMLVLLDEVGICASAGSACKSGSGTASPVLAAMGLSPEDARASLRLSLNAYTTEDDIDYALEQIPDVVRRMRSTSRA